MSEPHPYFPHREGERKKKLDYHLEAHPVSEGEVGLLSLNNTVMTEPH